MLIAYIRNLEIPYTGERELTYRYLSKVFAHIHARAVKGKYHETPYGICGIMAEMFSRTTFKLCHSRVTPYDLCHIVGKLSASWECYSGDREYPVPSDALQQETPRDCYGRHLVNQTLWCGKQLDLRLSLLQHLIKTCESQLTTTVTVRY